MDGDVYKFTNRWVVNGPIETVFNYVTDARTFHLWFPVFKSVTPDDPTGPVKVGSHVTAKAKALLPYVLDWDITVSRHEPPKLQETAVKLSLNGRFGMTGYVRYRFEQLTLDTVVVYNEQELAAAHPLPGLLHPLAQAAFAFNHDLAMSQAQRPLQAIVSAAASRSAAA
jgi:uncharacterized protein YndB with AHSA1/START domain